MQVHDKNPCAVCQSHNVTHAAPHIKEQLHGAPSRPDSGPLHELCRAKVPLRPHSRHSKDVPLIMKSMQFALLAQALSNAPACFGVISKPERHLCKRDTPGVLDVLRHQTKPVRASVRKVAVVDGPAAARRGQRK